MLTEKKTHLQTWGLVFYLPSETPPPPWFGKRPHFFRFFFGPLPLQWDEVKMEGRGEGVWNECDDSWEWIQWKYRCLQTKPRKVHLQLFQVRKKQIDFFICCLASISYSSIVCQQSTRRVTMNNNARLTGPYWSSLLFIFTSNQVWPQTTGWPLESIISTISR